MKVIVSSIQRFCLHDGLGIRTTVFFKGCNLKCPWCSNPENLKFDIEDYEYEHEKGVYGYEITLEDLEKEILKDKEYYENNGGVTFSGGECLLQFNKIEPLLMNLKEKGINICVETSLMVPTEMVNIAIKYVDEFIVDIKILEKTNVYKINGDLKLYKENIQKLFNNDCNITFRIPLVPEYIVTKENIEEIISFLKQYRPEKVEIFKIHRLGEKKYKTLGKKMPEFLEILDKQINEIKYEIENLGIKVEYCKI